ncbi:terminase large subunit [Streptomyces phage JPandJE]|nr:terminase large subunit [Streptomyces phage JPandJE]
MAKVYVTEDGRKLKTPPRQAKPRTNQVKAAKSDTQVRKQTFIKYVKNGKSIKEACQDMGLTEAQYKYLRQSDAAFRDEMDRLRLMTQNASVAEENRENILPFPEWCEEYLDTKLFNHHLQWVDVLEGRDPRNLHENQTYIKGEPEFLLINTPPEHAKSTTITMNYVTYRICQDPNIRVIIVSQTQEMAKRFLRGIKDRLASENKNYQKLQIDFGPEGGFDDGSAAWTADSIYVSSSTRDSGEKDPTVQALGIGGHIYGSRADLIILDDCVTGKNAHEFEKQMDWLQREVYNRLSYPGGRILLVGTRLAPIDLYGEITKDDYYGEEQSPWTYLTQPAVLEFDDDPEKWVTLWPRTNRPPVSVAGRQLTEQDENGLWPMWTGEALRKRRASMSPKNWALVYMQESVVEDAIFPVKAVTGCVDGMRAAGIMKKGAPGHRKNGMDGLYIVAGFDPAMTGHSASVVLGVDRYTGERWVLDLWSKGGLKPDDIFDKIKELTVKYNINEWRIEKNAMNLMVTQNRDIKMFLGSRGCLLREHFTGKNKWDADFGVASMSVLFENWERGDNLIHLPSRSGGEATKMLIEQLTTWEPLPPGVKTRKKTDLVMALWFAEIRARELINEGDSVFHVANEYQSPRDRERSITIDLDYMAQANMSTGQGSWWGS